MRLVVTGATGFIGTALCAALWERGHVLTLFTRGSPRDDEIFTEETPPRDDFLAALCQAWEAEAQKASELGMGVVRLRTGIVLGPGGGALAKMAEPFKFYMGGPLTGQRVVPAAAEKLGFKFRYPNLHEALEASKPI